MKCHDITARPFPTAMSESPTSLGEPCNRAMMPLAGNQHDSRKRVITLLGLTGNPEAAHLLTSYINDSDWQVRSVATLALGRLRNSAYMQFLIDATHDSYWRVRRSAAMALGIVEDNRAIVHLINLLSDCKWSVCRSAAISLGDLKATEAIHPLADALNDSHWQYVKLLPRLWVKLVTAELWSISRTILTMNTGR